MYSQQLDLLKFIIKAAVSYESGTNLFKNKVYIYNMFIKEILKLKHFAFITQA